MWKRRAKNVLKPIGQLFGAYFGGFVLSERPRPERCRILLDDANQRHQLVVLLAFEKNRRTSALHAILVARYQELGDLLQWRFDLRGLGGQNDARREPNQVICKGHLTRFIKVVHPPGQPFPRITPDAKIFDVQISNHQQHIVLSLAKLRTLFAPSLQPPIERRAKKRKCPASHLAMLSLESSALQIGALRQPRLIGSAGLNDIHVVRVFPKTLLLISQNWLVSAGFFVHPATC